MNMDDLQNLWREQPLPAAADATTTDAVIADVKRQARAFDRAIWWRDLRETAASLVVAFVFGRIAWARAAEGASSALAWVAAGLPLVVAAFLFLDRWRHRHLAARAGDAVLVEIDRALGRLRHQVWLLRNVVWWYLAPLAASAFIVAGQAVAAMPGGWAPKLIVGGFMLVLLTAVDVWVWRLNRRAISHDLEPRIQALEQQRALLGSF